MKKTLSKTNSALKPFTTLSVLFALILACFPIKDARGQTQAVIRWSQSTVNVNLRQNNTPTFTTTAFGTRVPAPPPTQEQAIVRFHSTMALNGFKLEISSGIAPFVRALPASINSSLPAYERQTVNLFFSVPVGTRVGRYEGTVQVRSGNVLIPGTLKVVIDVRPSNGDFTLIGNATDPLLFRAVTPTGETLEYFGERDSEGIPTIIDSFRLTDISGNKSTYFFDNLGRPIRFEAFNGVIFDITWLSNTRMILRVTTENGDAAVTLPVDTNLIDVSQLNSVEGSESNSILSFSRVINELKNLQPESAEEVSVEQIVEKEVMSVPAQAFNNALENLVQDSENVTIRTSQCNLPADATINLDAISTAGRTPTSIKRLDTGIYQALFPRVDPNAGANFATKCQKTLAAVDKVCSFLDTADIIAIGGASALLESISAELELVLRRVLPVAVPGVLRALSTFTGGLSLFCSLGGVNTVCGAARLAIDSGFPTSLEGTATLDKIIERIAQNRNSSGSFNAISVNFLANNTKVSSFTTSPVLPDTTTGYTVSAVVGCVPPNALITIRIVGQDGYQDSALCNGSVCSLTVPGNRISREDTVIISQNGTVIKAEIIRLSLLGSIEVRDNGPAADDAFQVSIDGRIVGQTAIGRSNELPLGNLSSGTHILGITAIVAPDNIGTYGITLRNGLTFSGGGNTRSGILPQGGSTTFTIVVP
jgi:hypothetical protein